MCTGDTQADLGKIEDLTRNPAQRRPDQRLVTALATLGNMHHDLVGHRAPRQMAASMTVLTARLTRPDHRASHHQNQNNNDSECYQ